MQHTHLRRAAAALFVLSIAGAATMVPAAEPGRTDPPDAAPTAPMCGEYDQLRSFLDEQFDEQPTSSGLADDGSVMQVFASVPDGTWTMVSVDRDGMACVLATGQAWQQDELSGKGEPA